MRESIFWGASRRLLALLLGAALALGLASVLGAQKALAADDAYTLTYSVDNGAEGTIDGKIDNYKLGTGITVEVPLSSQETLTEVTSTDNNVTVASYKRNADSVTVNFTVEGEVSWHGCIVCKGDHVGGGVARWVFVSCTKNTPEIPLESVTIEPTSATLVVGQKLQLKTSVTPVDATHPDLNGFDGYDKSIIDVDGSGLVEAVGEGTTTVTVKSQYYPEKTATCKITVYEPVESVSISKTAATLNVGETLQLNAIVTPEGASQAVDWDSGDKSVAEVDGLGKVKAVAPGTATITVKSMSDTSKTATCTVTVNEAVEPDEKGTYTATAGDGSTWTKNSGKELSFTFNRTESPETTYKRFSGIKVDGKDVDYDNYTATEGSVNIALKASYLETLSVGDHTLTAVFEDGSADAKFTVKAVAAASSAKSTAAKTGDTAPVALLASCAALSAALLAVLVAARTRRSLHASKHVRR